MSQTEQVRELIERGRKSRTSGDRTASLDAFAAACALDPTNATAVIESGYDYLHVAQIPQARAAFERGLDLDPDNKAALIGLGHTFRHLKQLADAERAFRRVLALEPNHGGASMGLGYTLKSMSRSEDALQAFQSAATATSNNSALVEAANLLRELGRIEEAVAALRDVVAHEPSKASHLRTLSQLLTQSGNPSEAASVLRQAIALDPSDLGLRIELGHRLREIDALDDAQQVLGDVLQEAPENISALNALGWVHRKARHLDQATACFQKIVELQPANIGTLRALGMIARERGDHEASLRFFERAAEHSPDAPDLQIEIGNCLHKLARFDEAIERFARVASSCIDARSAHLGIGYALRSLGRLEQSLEAFESADRCAPSYPHANIEAGHILLRLSRPDEAERKFRAAIDVSPGNLAALVGLSYALRRIGRMDEAEAALREALAAQPDNNGARIALGHLLEAQYRLDEAADLFSAVVASQPNHADSLAALGNIMRRRGDRNTAIEMFRRAAKSDPTNKARLIEIAVELRDQGEVEQSSAMIDDVLASSPAEARALMQRGLLMRRQDRRADALQAFIALLEHHPDNVQAMIEAATEERALGRPESASEWLKRALQTEIGHAGALSALAELAVQRDEPEEALALYMRAAAAHPTNVWVRLGAARTVFELGRREEAFETIEMAREQIGAHPEMVGMEVELLRHLRDWPRARDLLDKALAHAAHPNFWLWSHRVQIMTLTGSYADAETALDAAPATSVMDRARVALFQGQNAEAQFCYDEAIAAYRTSIGLNPGDAWAHFELSRAALMNLDLESSRRALSDFVRINRSSLLLKRQSLGLSQNHVGQLLDEFALDADALAQLRLVRLLPLDDQFEPLRRLVGSYPDYTPAAIITAIALRQGGRLEPRPAAGEDGAVSPIPRHIVQFWDSEPPDDVRGIMSSWRALNPQHRWTCFDDQQANDFLDAAFGDDVASAYRRTRMPAQKADLFRLAYLAARGGIYADADDRCLAPVDGFIRSDATLVVHQENYGSIGNNFIAATPEHPVIMRALDMAVAAMNRGDSDLVWLSTGPGLFTRAFAQEWATSRPGGLLRRTQVLDLGALQRVIGIHCPVRYKSTDRHWSR
ncbi:MAG: tetratricopeptide repeat protein, partial [Bradyrhizobium sp.]